MADNGDGRRPAYLPAKLLGYYWVVPGPFDMSLPPGEWEVTIRKGVEHIHLANVLKMGYTRRTRFEKWGFGKDYRITDEDYILVPGQEDPRTHQTLGHAIGLNTTSMVRYPDKYFFLI